MEKIKETDGYKIFKKRSGRHAVKDAAGKWVRGEDKVKVLTGAGLLKEKMAKKKEEPAPEAAGE